MYIRKLLTALLITAMSAQSLCFPVLAEESEAVLPVQESNIEISETQAVPSEEAASVIAAEAEVTVESGDAAETSETEAPAETEAPVETVADVPVETEADAPVETEAGVPVETEADVPAETTADVPAETTADVPAETEAPAETVAETQIETEAETAAEETLMPEETETAADEEVLLDAVPPAATNLKAVASDTYVTLSWTYGADTTGYRIEMQDVATGKTTLAAVTQISSGKSSYKITGLKPQHSYRFRLQSWKGKEPNYTFGEYTGWVSVKTVLYTPAAPTNLKISSYATSAKLSWTAGKYAQKYRVRVYDKTTKTSFWGPSTSSTSVTVTGLTKGHSYKYRVQGYRNAAGTYTYSEYTPWTSGGTVIVTPGSPSGLKATVGDKWITLRWTAGKYAQKYRVRIYDCVTQKSSWAAFTASTSVKITGLDNNHSYKFRVQSYRNTNGTYTYSGYTSWLTAVPTPLAGAKAIGWNNSVILEWPSVSGATQYKIFSVNLSTGEATWIRSLGSNHNEYRVNGLKNGKTYAYRIYIFKDGKKYAYSRDLKATAAEPRAKYVSTAFKYLGATEGSALHKEIIDLYNTQNPVPAGYKMTYTAPWCAAFATAMAVKANVIRMIPGECSCTRQIALWKQLGYYISGRNYTPSPGDLVYYSWTKNSSSPDHVGIVTKVSGSTLYVIEGNKSNSVSERVIDNYKSYGYIIGYGKPNGN